jgi:hypothetical protein
MQHFSPFSYLVYKVNTHQIMKKSILVGLFLLLAKGILAQEQQSLLQNMSTVFNEIKTATKNGEQLWNKNLYAPILLADPKTRQVFANEPDSSGLLKPIGNIFSGVLPAHINMANTAVNFNGKKWAMLMLPLPVNEQDRINLLAHELFHVAQPGLGFALHNPNNNHLDQKNGRVYLRLELEALQKAVQATAKKELRKHLTNAMIFRKYRHQLYPGADSTENLLEMNEGMAEFTGLTISRRTEEQLKVHFANELNNFLINPTFVRSFAYQTIPVYGYLLYRTNKNWNKNISPQTNLTAYFAQAFPIDIPADLQKAVEALSDSYQGKLIWQQETEREEKTKKMIAAYQLKFIEQAHFEIQFIKMNVSFDPRNIVPVGAHGTVYPKIRVTDLWGILTVENGALMAAGWDKISITLPTTMEEKRIIGEGWILELNDSYGLQKNEADGNYKLIKK